MKFVILEKARNQFHKKIIATYVGGKIKVWLVDGKLVRVARDIDFTEGGNQSKYEWIPEYEIWIDDDLDKKEIDYTILHELIEATLMASGYDYDKSHDIASNIELSYREKDKGVPKEILEKEAEKLVKVLNQKKHKLLKKSEVECVILEKAGRKIKLGRSEKKRLAKRRSIEKRAEKREDIKVYGESLEK